MARQTRREFLRAAGAAALLGMSGLAGETVTGRLQKCPNFVIIFCDDLGYADLGCYGSTTISTPRLDKMASEGMKFTEFYVAAPVCTPSRAALMTGCYPMRVGLPSVINQKSVVGINSEEITLAELLKTRGYATACIGKWHLGYQKKFLPTRHGFDHYFGLPYSNDMPGRDGVPLIRDEEVIERPVVQENLTERYTEEAVKFITANKDRPFFLYLPHTFPHRPLSVQEQFRGKSKGGLYGDVVERIDWSTGRILDTLKELGLDEDTLVIFTSDNGPWLALGPDGGCALPLRDGKATCWEGGMREPCIVRWPGHVPAGAVCSEMASSMDILPTFTKLAGAEPPKDRIIDGMDIRPLLAGTEGARTPHDALFYYYGDRLYAVRSGRWKLMLPTKDRITGEEIPLGLYDLKADISEKNNLADRYPKVVERLQALLERCRDDLGDSLTGRKGKNCRPCGVI
jgi:arylsulfatase A-like enzyme